MLKKQNIIAYLLFSLLTFASVFFLILSFKSNYAYSLFEQSLGLKLNTQRWLPQLSKILKLISFIFFSFALVTLFFNKILLFYKNNNHLFFLISFCLIAFVCRISCFGFASADYTSCLKPWFDNFKNNGLAAFRMDIGDYTVIYKYLILIISYLPVSSLYSYKFISLIFDFLLAFAVYKFVFEITNDKRKSLFSLAAVLFTPTFILNSSMWAQCDSIFTFFIILSCYYLYKEGRKEMYDFLHNSLLF